MRKFLLVLILSGIFTACKKHKDVISPPPSPPPPQAVLLKDIADASLPFPYYHFEYDSLKRASFVSFASDLTKYNVIYDGARISQMRSNTIVHENRKFGFLSGTRTGQHFTLNSTHSYDQ